MNHDYPGLDNFSGIARLFPLPNLVLFPFVMQGLHIFEPRYRQMTTDALTDDRLLTLALLRPGWESDYEGQPALYPVACISRIVADQRLDDGRFNLQVRGVSRVRLGREIENGKLYRSARVEVLEEIPIATPETEKELRRRLSQTLPKWCPEHEPAAGVFRKLLKGDLLLGMVCDILGFALPLAVEAKQQLLETLDVEERALNLLHCLETGSPAPVMDPNGPKFPPEFSSN